MEASDCLWPLAKCSGSSVLRMALCCMTRILLFSYDTNIPRQAGLSGPSAIVCASLNCLMKYYSVEQCIKMEDRPRIILSAENELGITAGLQDRVAQVYGGLVYMDFNKDHMVKTGNGIYTPMDPQLLPPLYIIFSQNPSDSGKVHSSVKKRWLEGDEAVRSDIEKVAELAMQGCDALIKGDHSKLAQLMNMNFDLRRKIFGDEVLGELNIKMVETSRSVGAACKFTGSGGAVVAFCPQGSEQVKQLEEACQRHGFTLQAAQAGLSGSSAIVCASLNCLMKYYSVEQCIKMEDGPRIILSAENELGITAGLQDRVAQVYGGLVYMDFNKDHMVKTGNGIYTPMDPQLLPPLYIIFSQNPSDSGKVHSSVKKRWLEGDEAVRSDIEKVAELAMQGCDALIKGDHSKLAQLMNMNFDLRRKIFGDEVLGELNIKMVETARSVGAACKFTGSGGAVVAFCPQGSEQVKHLEEACQRHGFTLQAAQVAQSLCKP